jgi:hypothetical protein
MPDGFLWLTSVITHYDQQGFAYSDVWICQECGAVVDGDKTTRHLSWHESLCPSN